MRKKMELFDIIIILVLSAACVTILLPLMHVVAGSLSGKIPLMKGAVGLWPKDITWINYRLVLENYAFWRAFRVTVFLVAAGTCLNMLFTVVTAYPLSKRYLPGRRVMMVYIIITMIFSAPLIPTYLLLKNLLLLNTVWVMIVPGVINTFNLILAITFFKALPEELFEAARVDGLSEYGMVLRIAMPMCLPIVATLSLFYAVGHWNTYSSGLYFVTNAALRPLQVYLYNIISAGNVEDLAGGSFVDVDITPEGLKMATIVTATLPIVIIYPFIQKYFIKGSTLGSLKE
ncbi:carbohydrate ABC transporter permease [Paenibacillus sp. YN15]|uniref:carbohydrate ABC transporter permease n=1 Tax=Paenibacillus sp. YN15 TaxID=1742774 RepID=UPI000DCE896C|nr:carbohydrate ABC transporter permease [Paenibacillus sp. YN15]RAU91150.1 ABC transporter permease [Paenibacillus sp. YN15]